MGAATAMGFCECGCGERTTAAQTTDRRRNTRRGEPQHFIQGHQLRGRLVGPKNPHWNGGVSVDPIGYRRIYVPHHPRANRRGYVFEHVLLAERALGKELPIGTEVHHVNGDRGANRGGNLVVCQDHAYHALLHTRTRARAATGDPRARQCVYCPAWIHPGEAGIGIARRGTWSDRFYHRTCKARDETRRRAARGHAG